MVPTYVKGSGGLHQESWVGSGSDLLPKWWAVGSYGEDRNRQMPSQ